MTGLPTSGADSRGSGRSWKIMVVDDHELARAGVISLLAGQRDLEIAAEAATGREAITRAALVKPDLVLMDIRMPEMDGLEATRRIKEAQPATSVVILTMHEDPDYLLAAVQAGAAGYLLKGSSKSEIVGGIRRVLGGESLLDPGLMARLVQRIAGEPKAAGPIAGSLSARELEVLGCIVEGKTNGEIAGALAITRATVKSHVERIISKLGVSDRTQAAVRAVQLGLNAAEPGPAS
ncbi:MAG TPA: response regulator transcription factor [Chloroflexota bacterium]|nr:response regulator transcription factor [Chloroflexota bacterium]